MNENKYFLSFSHSASCFIKLMCVCAHYTAQALSFFNNSWFFFQFNFKLVGWIMKNLKKKTYKRSNESCEAQKLSG